MTEESFASHSTFLDLAGSKLRSRLTSHVNEAASEGVTSKFARRHLEKLGWTEGTGLGKRRSGITTHIKVQKRADEQGGLGKSTVDDNLKIGSEWWKSSTGDVLAKLSSMKKKKKSKKKERNSKGKKKIFTDEELFQATGGARFGMRQGARQEGKWKRTEENRNLRDQEAAAKQQVEWDGKCTPKVILSSGSDVKRKKRKRSKDESEIENSPAKAVEKRSKKKRKKKDKKKES